MNDFFLGCWSVNLFLKFGGFSIFQGLVQATAHDSQLRLKRPDPTSIHPLARAWKGPVGVGSVNQTQPLGLSMGARESRKQGLKESFPTAATVAVRFHLWDLQWQRGQLRNVIVEPVIASYDVQQRNSYQLPF